MERQESNIVLINQYYYPFQTATAQLLEELAEYLAQNGKKISIITGTNGKKDLLSRESRNGVLIHRVKNSADGNRILRKFFSYLSFHFSLWKTMKIIKEQTILMTFSTPPLCGFFPQKYKKKKDFFMIINSQDLYPDLLVALKRINPNSMLFKCLRSAAKRIYNNSDRIVTVGYEMKGIISQRYRIDEGKITVIENWALDDLEKKPITPVKKENESTLKILYTGNMGRSHEYKTLLDGIKGLRNTPGIDFIITGGGYNYEIFKKEAERENLGNIHFRGFVPKKELSELIDSADLCIVIGNEELIGHVVPSKFYGYLSRAKPILYINSGNDEISHHISIGRFGFQIPNGSSEEFCKVVFDVYNNKAVLAEMSACAASYYASNLKRNISLDKYLFLIKESEETLAK